MTTRHAATAACCALTLLAPALSGCVVSSANATRIDGAYVQPNDLSRVKTGRSTKADVLDALSEPSAKETHDDGRETWTWNWTRTTSGSGTVLLLFSGSSKREIAESVQVTFGPDGVVTDKRRD